MAVKIDYWTQGYNGYWDGIWGHSIVAIAQLQIQDDPESRDEFLRGWNEANSEKIIYDRKQEYGNQR